LCWKFVSEPLLVWWFVGLVRFECRIAT